LIAEAVEFVAGITSAGIGSGTVDTDAGSNDVVDVEENGAVVTGGDTATAAGVEITTGEVVTGGGSTTGAVGAGGVVTGGESTTGTVASGTSTGWAAW
jgi:hypothetical protein